MRRFGGTTDKDRRYTKLSDDDVRRVRWAVEQKRWTLTRIAEAFSCSAFQVSSIARRKSRTDVE